MDRNAAAISSKNQRVSLKDLLSSGLLEPGEELMCEPRKGEPYTGRLTANGNIAFEGTIFGSSSDWASKIAGNSRNGWRDVSARGRPLSEFRERYEEGFRGPQQKVPKKPEESERIPDGGNEITPPVSKVSSITGELLNVIQLLSPVAFEKLIGEYLVAKGFSDIEVTGRADPSHVTGGSTALGADSTNTSLCCSKSFAQPCAASNEHDKQQSKVSGRRLGRSDCRGKKIPRLIMMNVSDCP
ncbi:MAG: hypothetical protein IIC85_11340 [Chloroflexi bacterium]|nr:hypothetical protein [Chloroflexota bacterium]